MTRVMMRCPETGLAVFTGVQLDQDTPHGEDLAGKNAVGCPHCGDLHDWTKDDVWFERSGAANPSGADGAAAVAGN